MKERYHLLDTIRGITLISMILFHGTWDIVYIFGQNWSWYKGNGAYLWQQSICWTFILLSGFCWSIGSHHLKRGLVTFGAGALVTVATLLVMYEDRVIFGVLTFLGISMLLLIPLDRLFQHVKPGIGLVVSMLLFFLTRNLNNGALGFEGLSWDSLRLPEQLYHMGYGMTLLGFTDQEFFSTDYFSLIPWFFLFLTGYFLYQILGKRERVKGIMKKGGCRPLEWIGRHSLILYLLHQPVIYLILSLIYR